MGDDGRQQIRKQVNRQHVGGDGLGCKIAQGKGASNAGAGVGERQEVLTLCPHSERTLLSVPCLPEPET